MRAVTQLAAALLAAVPACGDGGSPTATAEPVDLQIAIAGGDDQRGLVGTSLSEPLVVRVTDGRQAMSDVSVAWEVVEGEGLLSLKRGGRTDGQGLAAAVLFLGDQAGEHRISAALEDGDKVLFTARATPPVDRPREETAQGPLSAP